MRKTSLLVVVVMVLSLTWAVNAADMQPIPEELQLLEFPERFMPEVEGTGTHFKIENSDYLNISLTSSTPVSILLRSAGNMIEYDLKASDNEATTITLTGLEPSTKYYLYEDSYRNLTVFITDLDGSYSYKQDLSKLHHVWIQPRTSTYFISDSAGGGDCEGRSIGTWNSGTKTCTLTTNLNESVQINSDNITLDCANHSITGSETGYGVYIFQKDGSTIKFCNINDFTVGMEFYYSNNNTILYNTGSNETYGILLGYATNSTLTGNTTESSSFGINLRYSDNSTVTGNTTESHSNWGIILRGSNNNILTGNTAKSNGLEGFGGVLIWDASSNNILTGNTIESNGKGIHFGYSSINNQIEYNNIFGNTGYNLYNGQANNVRVRYNWWGTNNESEISAKIYDYYDDSSKGKAYFKPYLTIDYNTSLNITSPAEGSVFIPNETIDIEFTVSGSDQNSARDASVKYKLKDSDAWQTANATHKTASIYTFSANTSTQTGDYTLSVKTDSWGEDNINYTVSPIDLYIEWVKPIQVIEDTDLVVGKSTVVRVKVKNTGEHRTFTTRLTYDGGTKTFNRPVDIDELNLYTTPEYDINVLNFNLQFYSSAGSDTITVELDPNGNLYESNESNNTEDANVDIVATRELKVLFIPVDYFSSPYNYSVSHYERGTEESAEFLLGTYPIADTKFYKIDYFEFAGDSPLPCLIERFLGFPSIGQTAQRIYNEVYSSQYDRIVGVLPPGWFAAHCAPGAVGAQPNQWVSLIEPDAGESYFYYQALAHEISHSYRFCEEYSLEAYNKQNERLAAEGGCANPFPQHCIDRGETTNCEGGFDINGYWVNEAKQANYRKAFRKTIPGETKFCFMGRKQDPAVKWIEDPGYEYLLNEFQKFYTEDENVIIVSGEINLNGDMNFYPFYLTEAVPNYDIFDGNYVIEFQDINSNVLSDFNFTFFQDINVDVNIAVFTYIVPYDFNTYKIVGKYDSNVKAERTISTNAPTVTIISPTSGDVWTDANMIDWNASDTDGDGLDFALFYSNDNGTNWRLIASDLSDTNYLWDVNKAPPTNNYKVKVVATDGILTSEEDSNLFIIQNPDINLSSFLWDFGVVSQGEIVSKDFNITNVGNVDLNISSLTPSPDINISGISLPLILSSNESQTFTATIDTLNLSSIYSGDVNINSDDPNENPKQIFVDGNVQIISPDINLSLEMPVDVNYESSFNVIVQVATENAPLRDANVTLVLPNGLSTSDSLTKDLGYIPTDGNTDANWSVDTNQAGLYEVMVILSSLGNSDQNTSKHVSVIRIELQDLNAAQALYYPDSAVEIDFNVVNFDQNSSYLDVNIIVLITDPLQNIVTLTRTVPSLYANQTYQSAIVWSQTDKEIGIYDVNVEVRRKNGDLLDFNTTSFEVIPPTVQWTIGYGGKKIVGPDYSITYSILPQPTKKLIGVDYNILIGWSYYFEN